MQLAARAILLILGHALDAKGLATLGADAAVDFSAASAELKAQTSALLKCTLCA